MRVEQRLAVCRHIEKMEQYPECGKKLGIENISNFYNESQKRGRIYYEKESSRFSSINTRSE